MMEQKAAAPSSLVQQPTARPAQSVQALGTLGNIQRKPSTLPTFVAFQDAVRTLLTSVATAALTYPEVSDAELPAFREATEQRFSEISTSIEKFMTAADQAQLQLDKQSQHQLHSTLLGLTSETKLDETVALQKLQAEAREIQDFQATLNDFSSYLIGEANEPN